MTGGRCRSTAGPPRRRRGRARRPFACGIAVLSALPILAAPAHGQQDGGAEDCWERPPRIETYRDPRSGFGLSYPSCFVADPAPPPAHGDGRAAAEFWSRDGRATFVVSVAGNPERRPPADLLAAARRSVLERGGGAVTYVRVAPDWFVVSGVIGDRIVYQRTALADGGRVAGTLYINFPRDMRERLDAAVTLMSRSFRAGPGERSPRPPPER